VQVTEPVAWPGLLWLVGAALLAAELPAAFSAGAVMMLDLRTRGAVPPDTVSLIPPEPVP
jgi:hypothetical protein